MQPVMSSVQSDNLLNACAVTFDVDWAADWMIDRCVGICRRAGVQATFFATHPSDILSDLARDPLFEIGIHPNFLPNSTHGTDPARVLGTCLDLVPDARAMRSHGLYQWASLFHMIGDGLSLSSVRVNGMKAVWRLVVVGILNIANG